jgi:hypothetical protein
MKAKVSFHASKVPSFLFGSIPVVQKKDGQSGVNFANKAELAAWVEANGTATDADTFMVITCQCGSDSVFATDVELPATDLTCPCGRKLIQYDA